MGLPVTPPIPVMPGAPRITFDAAPDSKLQGAVSGALAELSTARGGRDIPFSLAIIDLNRGAESGGLKWGAHKPHEEHYTASEVKICALYAAFALFDMVTRFASAMSLVRAVAGALSSGPAPAAPPLFDVLRTIMDPAIEAAGNPLLGRVARGERVPRYDRVFATRPAGSPLPPAFTGGFLNSMHEMMVVSDNHAAGRCALGVGYAYLNATMAHAGLFDDGSKRGAWLSADYVAEPHRLIDTANDKMVGQASSALSMAKLLALIVNRAVLDGTACDAMRALLKETAEGPDQPWLTRVATAKSAGVEDALRFPRARVTHAKLGLGPLKVGGMVSSETFRLQGARHTDRSYAVAFQNVNQRHTNFGDVAFMVWKTLELYEG